MSARVYGGGQRGHVGTDTRLWEATMTSPRDELARQERENLERLDALLDRLDTAIETVSRGVRGLKRWAEPPDPNDHFGVGALPPRLVDPGEAEPYEHPDDCDHPDCQLPF